MIILYMKLQNNIYLIYIKILQVYMNNLKIILRKNSKKINFNRKLILVKKLLINIYINFIKKFQKIIFFKAKIF